MTMAEEQNNPIQQATVLLMNRVVVATVLAVTLPTLILAVLVFLANPGTSVAIFIAPVLAFLLVGIPAGLFVYNTSYTRLDQILHDYTAVLDRVAAGDLRQRLTLPEMNTATREGQMLAHLCGVVNRTLDNFQIM